MLSTRRAVALSVPLALLVGCSSGAVPSASVAPTTPTAVSTPSLSSLALPSATPSPLVTTVPSAVIPTSPPPGQLASTTVLGSDAPTGAIRVEMRGPPPIFRPSELDAKAGDVVFFLVNYSPALEEHGTHTLAIGPEPGSPLVVSDELKGGQQAVFTVHGLEAGTYAIWCTFPGHGAVGQTGTLTVE